MGGALLLSFPLIIVTHELIHAVAFPRGGDAGSTFVGVWPSRLLFYAHYDGVLSRGRFLFVMVLPFAVISLLPLLAAWATGSDAGPVTFFFAWCSTWNAAFACGDLFGIGLVLAQIPRRALLRNRGYRTYWQPRDLLRAAPAG